MLKFDKELVKQIMIEECGYPSRAAADEVFFLGDIDAELQPVIDAYIADRTISDAFGVEGLTTQMIMDKYGVNFCMGLLFMNGFIKDLDRAKRTRNDLTPIRHQSLGGN